MDLWIRSQDRKRLLKCDNFSMQERVKEQFLILAGRNGNHIIGTYKDKERALQVLDEIQKLIIGSSRIIINRPKEKFYYGKESFIEIPKYGCYELNLQTLVYEMPKE